MKQKEPMTPLLSIAPVLGNCLVPGIERYKKDFSERKEIYKTLRVFTD